MALHRIDLLPHIAIRNQIIGRDLHLTSGTFELGRQKSLSQTFIAIARFAAGRKHCIRQQIFTDFTLILFFHGLFIKSSRSDG
jgi:hypothetical protein